MVFQSSYKFLSSDEWNTRILHADRVAQSCTLCPRKCKVNRFKGEKGFCKAPGELFISSIFPHHGEEPPLSGTNGSGTVFFSYCTLQCVFCQNYQISHYGEGESYTIDRLAKKMLYLQEVGCHNINLVTPVHFLPWILKSLKLASDSGLNIPIVYNCGGYESLETLKLLSGIVDIYLPDMKYGDNSPAGSLSKTSDYVSVNQDAIREMFRQVGPLKTDNQGIAYQGLLIRHLVLPEQLAGSRHICEFLKSNFDPADITLSVMAQYRPLHKAMNLPEISRQITYDEYNGAKALFIKEGFDGYYQTLQKMDESFVIDFKTRKSRPLK